MKPTKLFSLWKPQPSRGSLSLGMNIRTTASWIVLLAALALLLWFMGPQLKINGYQPLASVLIRFYIISALFLLWVLKFLWLDIPAVPRHATNKLTQLQYRFRDACAFLKRTTLIRQEHTLSLMQLPWYLLLGAKSAGKTALLANADLQYILQKQFLNTTAFNPSEHCNWWITANSSIVDVPSCYAGIKNNASANLYRYFLELAKKERGTQAIQGIIIALPLPELLNIHEQKYYINYVHNILFLLNETKKVFSYPLATTIIITKCDLLPGFTDFFAEQSIEELTQTWGMQLVTVPARRLPHYVANRFNALLKKLNQQLLWRLHHERNPLLRPSIKDFPLQMERLKVMLIDFMRKYSHMQNTFPLQGIYFTSALQPTETTETLTTDTQTKYTNTQAIQLFTAPKSTSQAYFIKQLMADTLTIPAANNSNTHNKTNYFTWGKAVSITAASVFIAMISWYLSKDWQLGLNKVYAVKNDVIAYQQAAQTIQNSEQQLQRVTDLLTLLAKQTKTTTLNLQQLPRFYSYKSQLNVNAAYQKALSTLLLPAVRNYLADVLQQPTHHAAATTYAVLQAYLMLGNGQQKQTGFIIATLNALPLTSFSNATREKLFTHLRLALQQSPAVPLDNTIITATRNYLTALPTLQLAYSILQNTIDQPDQQYLILPWLTQGQHVFKQQKSIITIARMYTYQQYTTVLHAIPQAVLQATQGNWVIGYNNHAAITVEANTSMQNDLQTLYMTNYIAAWEKLLQQVQLTHANDVVAVSTIITHLTSKESPLLKLLQIVYNNTYFQPIINQSERLKNLGNLIAKSRETNNLLYQVFASLKGLQQYLQPVLLTNNQGQAAFNILATRMKNPGTRDAITQLRLLANKSPEPINHWLIQITDATWDALTNNAKAYIDVAWQPSEVSIAIKPRFHLKQFALAQQ